MNEKDLKILKKVVGDTFFPQLVNSLIKEGIINNDDLDDKLLVLQKVKQYLNKNKNLEFPIITDYRTNILELAESNYNKNYEFSITLYATYIEHTLNSLINIYCESKDIGEKTQAEIIRNVNFKGKYTWLLKLMGYSGINNKYLNLIQKISDERNSFIHYKWKISNDKNPSSEIELIEIKKLVKYLKTYETRINYNGNKYKIK